MSKRIKRTNTSPVNPDYAQLRKASEKFLYENSLMKTSEYDKEIKELFQELQVHQIELEMQNDELRRINVELEKQRGRFSGIYNLAPLGYFIVDHTGVVKDVNDSGIRLLDTVKSNIVGKRLQTFVTKDNSDDYYRFFTNMLKGLDVEKGTIKINTLTGTINHVKVAGISRSTGESSRECYVMFMNITDGIKAENELAETKHRLELSLKASLAGTWELDVNSMNFYLDESSRRICNMPQSEFSGKFDDFLHLVHPEHRVKVDQEFRSAINKHKEVDLVCRIGRAEEQECYAVIRGHLISGSQPDLRFGGIILDITEKTQMERSSTQLREEYQKRIASAMINTEENERKRISESLHDSVSQLLYGIKIQLGQLEKASPLQSNLNNIKKLLDQAIDETRNISFELAPSILTDFGLPATIEELVKRLSSKELNMTVSIKGFFKRTDLLLETNIYRIVQELVNNSMKHSSASEIHIDISKNKFIEITVRDNGRGYNVKDQENSASGSGLSSIRNRLRIYNGSLSIESAHNKGTTVYVKLYESASPEKHYPEWLKK